VRVPECRWLAAAIKPHGWFERGPTVSHGAPNRFTRNNGITEGFHTKMELISRQAYGFRNFEDCRMRVKVLCA